ncbi:TetR/AcrR family transcriptional regulator [Acetobacterium woodii]|uniref:Transcriptional regulator TetR family n=1 Tax=Acetobacterium woodii (strain ATCC 29683 / DSM 1030 / JCM 2381 / KCTC 1655 / WB1) TaxID=931626 RepID=H6LEN1_ACEWD|nr:TetR/AcrR family transcriptional regulator [Acetobacterium woodii]AFA48134.1 transcriptional regulator TetR family [Acetobacterium woodii DSM 1030]
MGKYKVGKETKEKIYETSKTLFYEYGYTNTTCLKIAKESGANVGLINYYYGSKGGLGIDVYNEIMSSYKARVTEKLAELGIETSLLLQTAVEMRLINNNIRINKNFSRFYYDLLSENVIYKEQSVMTDFYRNLAESCGLNYSEFEIAFITYTNMGATQGSNLAYDAGLIDCSSLDFVNANIYLLLSNMRLDAKTIDAVILESQEIEKLFNVRIEKNFAIS